MTLLPPCKAACPQATTIGKHIFKSASSSQVDMCTGRSPHYTRMRAVVAPALGTNLWSKMAIGNTGCSGSVQTEAHLCHSWYMLLQLCYMNHWMDLSLWWQFKFVSNNTNSLEHFLRAINLKDSLLLPRGATDDCRCGWSFR